MRILIVGAGAIGGYFGGRLVEKGEDVTFLVREKRKQQLEQTGLSIKSFHGDLKCEPKTLISGEKTESFDIILMSTKAYHLNDAISSIHPYVGETTLILPLLNGINHMNQLNEAFGKERVLGGLCFIETTLNAQGEIIQTSPIHDLVFGEQNGEKTERILKLAKTFEGTKATFRLSDNIEQEMWHKYLFITTLSGVTSLFRSPIGPILEQQYGGKIIRGVASEAIKIMTQIGAPIAEQIEEVQWNKIQEMNYNMKSSLQRDMEKVLLTEADHLYGYLLTIAEKYEISAPILSAIYTNVKVYENLLSNNT